MLLWFGPHTGDTRPTELLYVVMNIWSGIMSYFGLDVLTEHTRGDTGEPRGVSWHYSEHIFYC